jgi:fibronectin-binding autotransporter adhesin
MAQKNRLHYSSRILTTTIAAALALPGVVSAASLNWDSDANFANAITDGSGTWDTVTAQWNNGAANVTWNNTNNDIAVFGNGLTGGVAFNTVSLLEPITVGGITLQTSNVSSGYTIADNTLTLAGATPTITAALGTNSTITSVLAGTGGMIFTGGGSLTLTAFNTYTGGTTVNAGNLILSGTNNPTGIIRETLTINAGARVTTTTPNAFGYNADRVSTLNINGGLLDDTASGDQGWAITVNLTGGTMQTNGGVSSNTTAQLFALGGGSVINTLPSATTSTIAGRVNLRENNLNDQLAFNVADGEAAVDLLVSAAITANATTRGIAKTGAGTMQLSGLGSYQGNVTIDGGTLIASRNAALGANNGTRTVTVNNPGTVMSWTINNVFVGAGSAAANLPIITLNAGTTMSATRYNAIGNINLNGATLTQAATDSGNYEGYQFLGTVTVGGTAASTISSDNNKANHLRGNATTIFDVADVTGTAAADLTISNPIRDGSGDYTGVGSLEKTGAGTMVLTGQNLYVGTTTVTAGTLALRELGSLSSTSIIVSPGAILDVSGLTLGNLALGSGQMLTAGRAANPAIDVAGNLDTSFGSINVAGTNVAGTMTLGGNLTLSGGAVRMDLANVTTIGSGVNDLISVGNLSLSGTTEIVINKLTGALTNSGTYTLFRYSGALTGNATNLTLSGAAGGTTRQTFALDTITTPGSVLLNVAGTSANLTWVGGAAGNLWDVNNTVNWSGAPDGKFFDGDAVTFSDSGSAVLPVTINSTVQPASLTVNSSKDYSFTGSGAIGGLTGISKSGTGKLSTNLLNTFTGAVNLTQGILSIDNVADNGQPSALGAGTQLNIGGTSAPATLQFTGGFGSTNRAVAVSAGGATFDVTDQFATLTLTGPISGAGNVVKSGPGSLAITSIIETTGSLTVEGGLLTLSRVNTYTGGTVVNGGTLALTIGGETGAIRGELTVNPGATVLDSAKDAIGYGLNRVTTLNINGGTYSHVSANNVTLWGMNINMTGGLLESTDPVSTIDVGTAAAIGNVPTAVNTFASANSATIAGTALNLRQANTTFTVADGAASADLLISAPILAGVAGAGITKAGPGTMRVTATSTYTGQTEALEGTLIVAGSIAGSQFNVNSGATLGGAGFTGPVTVFDGGIVSPGEGIGTLSTGSLSLSETSALLFDLWLAGMPGGTNSDLLQIGGDLTLDGRLQVVPQSGFGAGTYQLMSYTGFLFDNSLQLDAAFLATYPRSFVDTGTAGVVNLVVVPEASTALLFLSGLAPLLARRRRVC